MEKSYALEINNLSVAYDTTPILQGVNLKIPSKNLVAIIGPNGAGKTTLLKTILNIKKPILGTISFPILKKDYKPYEIAYIPQSSSVDWDFPTTVLDVVLMGRYAHLGLFKRPLKKDRELALEKLDLVGMYEYADRPISKLSGGQQQRVFLARALAQQAKIYFLDEPFKGVDAKTEKIIVNLLKDLKNQGKTVLVVHHNLDTVFEYFDWVTFINKKVIANGKVGDVFNDENINLTYNKKIFKRGDLP